MTSDLTPYDDDIAAAVLDSVRAFVDGLPTLDVETDEDRDRVTEIGREATSRLERITEQRFSYTRPLKEEADRWIEGFKNPTELLTEIREQVKANVLLYNKMVSEEREAERARLESAAIRAAEEGRLDDAQEALAERDAVPVKVEMSAGSGNTGSWKAMVEGEEGLMALVVAVAEGKAPLTYLLANEKELRAASSRSKGKSAPPGVTFWYEAGMSLGGRR